MNTEDKNVWKDWSAWVMLIIGLVGLFWFARYEYRDALSQPKPSAQSAEIAPIDCPAGFYLREGFCRDDKAVYHYIFKCSGKKVEVDADGEPTKVTYKGVPCVLSLGMQSGHLDVMDGAQ